MKKCCKHVDILAPGFIEKATYEALDGKWRRRDVAKYFCKSMLFTKVTAILDLLKNPEERKMLASGMIQTSAENLRYEIETKSLTVRPIRYEMRHDGISGKVREIGIESVKQLILDEVASEGLDELWRRKLGYHQYASIKGKGQLGGKRAIEKQIRKRYLKSRYAWKGDVRKCYPSIDRRKLKHMLERDVKNPTLLHLTFFLIDTYKQGLNIGSGLSQFLCNYYLARAYNFVLGLTKIRKHKDGTMGKRRLVYFAILYMDDILIIGSRKADVRMDAKALEKYLRDEYALTIKPDWDLFPIDYMKKTSRQYASYREKDKAVRRGKPIDMMGWMIYRDHTEIRSRIFLRARRAYSIAWRCMVKGVRIPLRVAQKCTSYFGYFKHTDSAFAKWRYNMETVFKAAKRRISENAKCSIYGSPAQSALATG